MSRSDYIHLGCDNDVTFNGALNASTGNYLNSATCTFTLYADNAGENGGAILGAVDVAMPYVDVTGLSAAQLVERELAPGGNYVGVLQSTVSLTRDAVYWLERHLVQGDIVLHKRKKVRAVNEGDEAG